MAVRKSVFFVAVLWLLTLCGSAWAVEGMVSYWKFDESDGTTAYDWFGLNDGTIHGAEWTTGPVDGALSFDRNHRTYVSVPDDASLNITGDITISAWVYCTRGGSYQAIVTKCAGAGPRNNPFDFRTHETAEPQLAFVRADASGHERVYSRTRISLGEWHHVLVRVENKVPDFYIDGVDAGKYADTTFTRTPTGNTKPLLIGKRDDGLYFNGIIDEVAIYNRALSAEEIQEHYQNGLNGYGYPIDFTLIPIKKIEHAIAEMLELLERIDAALETEWIAYAELEELLKSGDYGDLTKGGIVAAKQKIHSAIQHQEQSKKALERSIEKMQDALAALGREPLADEPAPE
ncbi:MAG TPA: LamG domain-containing protein [Sedimentisphaerales bacterium]|nr:LamG domain-containing protein [Sedimentisphaerales bacterium]